MYRNVIKDQLFSKLYLLVKEDSFVASDWDCVLLNKANSRFDLSPGQDWEGASWNIRPRFIFLFLLVFAGHNDESCSGLTFLNFLLILLLQILYLC